MKIKAADLFCGAGGTSTGLAQACAALGLGLDLVAVNHWQIAIDTHSANHPDVNHICAALESLNPRALVPSGRLDLLVASPECTHFSTARGGKPISDQKRASPYLILRWAEALRIDRILIENVPEFRTWGPIGVNGRPLKSKKGTLYHHFLDGLRALGYSVEDRILNAADYGDPTTRRRLFIQARLGRTPIVWPAQSHSQKAVRTLFGKTKSWKPAREIIDWSIPSRSIFGRKKPLADATMRRILAGLERFGGEALKPFLVQLTHGGRLHSVDNPLPTVTAAHRGEVGLSQPFVLQQQSGGAPRATTDPLPTIAAGGAIALVQPFICVQRTHNSPKSVDDPIPPLCTGDHMALVQPFLVPFYGEKEGQASRVHSVDEPIPTIPASPKFGIAQPFIAILRNNQDAQSLDEPTRTITTSGAHLGLVQPFLVKYNGTADAKSIDEPIDTIPAKDRFGLVTPEVDGYVLDVHFRMLQPHELAAAMGFPADYKFTGNREDRVRQIGNAVPVGLAAALCSAILAPLAQKSELRQEAAC